MENFSSNFNILGGCINIEVGSEVINIELLKFGSERNLEVALAAKLISKFRIEIFIEVDSDVNIEPLKLKFSIEVNIEVGSEVNIELLKIIIEVNIKVNT